MPARKPLSKISHAMLVGLAFLLPPLDSTALEWSAQPSVAVGSRVHDNIDLETTPQGIVWASSISPQLLLSARSAQSALTGRAQINRHDYSDKSVLSHTNGLLDLLFTRQYELSQLSLAGTLARDSTLESELIETGIVTSRAQRTSLTLSPSWVYSITERDSINLGYSYIDVSYGATTTTSNLQDYVKKDPSITLSHEFTEKNKLSLSFGYSDYQSQTPISLTNSQYKFATTSAQLGFIREFSDTLNISLQAGLHKTDSSISGLVCQPLFPFPGCISVPIETNNSDTGSLFKATLRQAFESSQLTVELSRSLQPTADGGLAQSDRLSGGYSAKLTPTLTSSLNMSIYQSQNSAVSGTTNHRRYYSVTPTVTWQITERWATNASYSRSVSQNASGAESTGNAIDLTLNYNWPKISKSR